MKKLILSITVFFATALTINAQEISENAIGLRFANNSGFGIEISYQRKLTEDNRLEVDLGIRGNNTYSYFKGTGLYQWVGEFEERFNWYAGFGGGLGNWNIKSTSYSSGNSEVFFFGAGIVGVEYNFDGLPLLMSFDFRPEFGFSNYYKGFSSDFGLGIRYQF